jgi:hypothetical protein
MNDIDILINAIEAIIDKKFNEVKLEIKQLSHQVQMIQTQTTGPNTFFEAMSNPAFQE